MNRLRTNPVPCIPLPAFPIKCQSLNILHLNISGLHTKTIDVQADPLFKQADVISHNESHMGNDEGITTDMLGITNNFVVFNCNCDTTGGGIALAVNKKFLPSPLFFNCSSEILVVQLQQYFKVVLVCIYRPPAKHICTFTEDLAAILVSRHNLPICVVGDFNEDILLAGDSYCNKKLQNVGFHQIVAMPTRHSGTLIDHVYISPGVNADAKVADWYYNDHDFVLASIVL